MLFVNGVIKPDVETVLPARNTNKLTSEMDDVEKAAVPFLKDGTNMAQDLFIIGPARVPSSRSGWSLTVSLLIW